MHSISDFTFEICPVVTTKEIVVELPEHKTGRVLSTRAEYIEELYQLSVSQPYETTKENRRRYHEWVRKNHPTVCRKNGFNKDSYISFKPEFKAAKLPKEQKYLKPHRLLTEKELKAAKKALAMRLCRVPTSDLPHMVSTSRDILHRYERANYEEKPKYIVGKYIWGSIIWKK